MSTSTKPDPTQLIAMREALQAKLPDLELDALDSLAATVYDELTLRVGTALAEGLRDAQLAEFEALIDAGDDEACSRWLDEHRPNHREIVKSVREKLIAETVTTIAGAERHRKSLEPQAKSDAIRRVGPVDVTTIAELLDRFSVDNSVHGDRIDAVYAPQNGDPFRLRLSTREGRMLIVESLYATRFPVSRQFEISAFVNDWNRRKYFPKAYVMTASDDTECGVVAEVAHPLAPGLHRELCEHLLVSAIGAIADLIDEIRTAFPSTQLELPLS